MRPREPCPVVLPTELHSQHFTSLSQSFSSVGMAWNRTRHSRKHSRRSATKLHPHHCRSLCPFFFFGLSLLFPVCIFTLSILVASSVPVLIGGGGGGDRTHDLRIKSPLLLPAELHPHILVRFWLGQPRYASAGCRQHPLSSIQSCSHIITSCVNRRPRLRVVVIKRLTFSTYALRALRSSLFALLCQATFPNH